MVQKVLNGDTGEGPRSIITACRGLALNTEGRMVRPVAIGMAIGGIAARVACLQDNEASSEHLKEVMQCGVEVRGGIEYAYHSVRLHMMALWNQYEV